MNTSSPTGAKNKPITSLDKDCSPPKRPRRDTGLELSDSRRIGHVPEPSIDLNCTAHFNNAANNGIVNLNHLFGITPGGSSMAASTLRVNRKPFPTDLQQGLGVYPNASASAEGSSSASASANGSSSAGASADPSSIGIVPQLSQLHATPIFTPGTPPGTPTGTPPGTPTRTASTHVGQCKGMGYVTDDGRWFVKPAYKDPDMKAMRTPEFFFKKSVVNALFELTWMDAIESFLENNPISIQVQGRTYTVHVVRTELTNTFEFKQPHIERDSMNPALKKEMSGEILKALLPQLWDEGLITALDIKPDNFHVSGDQIHIFDLYFPQDLIDSEEYLRLQICQQFKDHTTLPQDEYNQLTDDLFENHFNLVAARQLAEASKAKCDELIETHIGLQHYSESVLELAHPPTIVVNKYGFLGHLAYALFSQT